MKRYQLNWKQGLAALLAAALLFAAGCTVSSGDAPRDSAAAPTGSEPAAAESTSSDPAVEALAQTAEAPAETAADPEPTEKTVEETRRNLGEITDEQERLNYFVTCIVQQDIVNSQTDLDEDAELVRFAFRYLRWNDPDAVLEEEDGGVPCRTLTLGQVNETLNALFGKTISPDQEDYSIQLDENEAFYCVYRDGCFRNVAPYPTEVFPFPVRFALVEKIDEETCTVHFRLYRINPYAWGLGEAARHVPILPAMSIYDAESGRGETKDWIIKIGEGDAVFRDFGEELQLIELDGALYN
jgi:hypothetical protein